MDTYIFTEMEFYYYIWYHNLFFLNNIMNILIYHQKILSDMIFQDCIDYYLFNVSEESYTVEKFWLSQTMRDEPFSLQNLC